MPMVDYILYVLANNKVESILVLAATIVISYLFGVLTEESVVRLVREWVTTFVAPAKPSFSSQGAEPKSNEVTDRQPVIPRQVEFILLMFVRPEEEDALLGDLEERYFAKVKRYGKNAANTWLMKQIVFSICSRLKGMVTASNLLAVVLVLKKIFY